MRDAIDKPAIPIVNSIITLMRVKKDTDFELPSKKLARRHPFSA